MILYHIIVYNLINKKRARALLNIPKSFDTQKEELKENPLVNIIVPAWNEGDELKDCLDAIVNLSYPNIKVFINIGGNEKTLKIGNSYKNEKRFTILHQKKGEGKNKAINDCLERITEGLIYLIDADIYLTEDVFLKMIYYIINEKYDRTACPLYPHKSIYKKDNVKYLFIYRERYFRREYLHEEIQNFVGLHTCFSYDFLKQFGKFPEKRLHDDNIANDSKIALKKHQFKYIYDLRVQSFTYPTTIKESSIQNLRWLENKLMQIFKYRRYFKFFKFLSVSIISIYLFVFPFLFWINIYLFLFGLIILTSQYLTRIRSYFFYRKTIDKKYREHFSVLFFVKLIVYIYIDALNRIIAFFELIFFKNKYKKRKNLL